MHFWAKYDHSTDALFWVLFDYAESAKKCTANQYNNVEKHIQWVTTLSLTIRIRLAVVAFQNPEITRNSYKS